jgi:23S rRNA (guanosine2251-2'-O)-methyltransferase
MKHDEKTGDIVYGIHAVLEVLKAKKRQVHTVYTTREPIKAWAGIKKYIDEKKTKVSFVDKNILLRLAGSADHQGVAALVNPFGYRKSFFTPQKEQFILVLDRIQDPRNVGAIIRSAYCAGVDGCVLIKKSGCLLNAPAFKASAGLAEYMPIFVAQSSAHAAEMVSLAGYTTYAGALGGKNVRDVSFSAPCCVIVGNEASGIASEFKKKSTLVMLPQRNTDISYNASVAAGIMMFLAGTALGKI